MGWCWQYAYAIQLRPVLRAHFSSLLVTSLFYNAYYVYPFSGYTYVVSSRSEGTALVYCTFTNGLCFVYNIEYTVFVHNAIHFVIIFFSCVVALNQYQELSFLHKETTEAFNGARTHDWRHLPIMSQTRYPLHHLASQ